MSRGTPRGDVAAGRWAQRDGGGRRVAGRALCGQAHAAEGKLNVSASPPPTGVIHAALSG